MHKRSILGSLFFLVLVGEVTVGAANGLFTINGALVLLGLYYVYFNLLDGIVLRYKLNNFGLVCINFALYAVLITGLLHGEIADYVTHPEDNLITTLIRIQCSLTPLFVYYLLRNIKATKSIRLRTSVILFTCYISILSLSEGFGLKVLIDTFRTAPAHSVALSFAAAVILWIGLKTKASTTFESKSFTVYCWILFAVALIPGIPSLLLVIIMTIAAGLYLLTRQLFRNSAPHNKTI